MTGGGQADLPEHTGPWTERDYLALPEDRQRIELLDGSLLVSPSAGGRHRWLSSQLWLAMSRASPDGLQVLEAINVRVAPGKILIPDLAVVTNPGEDLTVWQPANVAMVVEISSAGNVAFDRAIKPELYARAGVLHDLRIELTQSAPEAAVYRLERGCYVAVGRAMPGETLRLAEPFTVEADLAALTTATRPPV